MLNKVFRFGSEIQQSVGHLDREHWIIISAVMLCVGIFFLRGFGSRTTY